MGLQHWVVKVGVKSFKLSILQMSWLFKAKTLTKRVSLGMHHVGWSSGLGSLVLPWPEAPGAARRERHCRVDQTTRSWLGAAWLCPLSLVSHNPACHGLQKAATDQGASSPPSPPFFLPILRSCGGPGNRGLFILTDFC